MLLAWLLPYAAWQQTPGRCVRYMTYHTLSILLAPVCSAHWSAVCKYRSASTAVQFVACAMYSHSAYQCVYSAKDEDVMAVQSL
jgi:hypothetical protein